RYPADREACARARRDARRMPSGDGTPSESLRLTGARLGVRSARPIGARGPPTPPATEGSMKRASIRLVASAALAASLPSIPSFAGNLTLTMEGIGTSIEVLSFNFNARNVGSTTSGGGGGAGKVAFSEFTFTATESAASPVLFLYVDSGKHSQ